MNFYNRNIHCLNTFESNTLFDIIWQKRYKIHIFVYSKTCYLYINIKQFYPFQLIFCDQLTANTQLSSINCFDKKEDIYVQPKHYEKLLIRLTKTQVVHFHGRTERILEIVVAQNREIGIHRKTYLDIHALFYVEYQSVARIEIVVDMYKDNCLQAMSFTMNLFVYQKSCLKTYYYS